MGILTKKIAAWSVSSFVVLGMAFASCEPVRGWQADLIVTGGTIRTMELSRPVVQAIAVVGDEIVAAGSVGEIADWAGPDTRIVRLQNGQTAVPGLIESHGHFVGLGESLMMLDLSTAKTWDEIVEQVRVAAASAPAGSWIIGRGWHQAKWDTPPERSIDGYPDNQELSAAAANHPVLLTHASGHMSMANDYALRLADLNPDSLAPSGGEFLKTAAGELSGVLRETAQGPVQRMLARDQMKMSKEESAARFAMAVRLAGEECWKNGITSFHDAGSSLSTVQVLRDMAVARQLPVRLYVMVRDTPEMIAERMPKLRATGLGNEFFTVRALKRSIDGALGPHGAWLLAPYADLPGSTGLNTDSVELVRATAEVARKLDLQLCVHAIGDRANREVLDMYEEILGDAAMHLDHRWRIEHAQHLHHDDIPRFGKLGVIAAMQGVHCTSDALYVPQRLGALRAENGAYVWRSLLDSGAVICNGTDAPVEKIDPIASLAASATRRLGDGSVFFPQQCMTREEALRSYTIDAARAAFEETRKGSLVPGKLADITILSADPVACSDDELARTEVISTIVGGKIVWSRNGETAGAEK